MVFPCEKILYGLARSPKHEVAWRLPFGYPALRISLNEVKKNLKKNFLKFIIWCWKMKIYNCQKLYQRETELELVEIFNQWSHFIIFLQTNHKLHRKWLWVIELWWFILSKEIKYLYKLHVKNDHYGKILNEIVNFRFARLNV